MRYEIILPYPPSTNRYWRYFRGHIVTSEQALLYKREVSLRARQAGILKLAGRVRIVIDIYRPARRGDLDNTFKVLLDSLNGVAYEDDSQIVELRARRFDDKDNPRAEVRIEEIG